MNNSERSDHNRSPDPAQGAESVPTISSVVAAGTARLRAAGVESARLDARILIGAVLDLAPDQMLCRADSLISPADFERIEALLARRAEREPVSRILGRREFWSLDFALSSETLDPRPDSETLVEAAVAIAAGHENLKVLDFGTGTGCLLLAVLSELPSARGLGVDLSTDALTTAAANAVRLGLGDRARFLRFDWRYDAPAALPPERYDLILSNPPYIPDGDIAGLEPEVARFDPRTALAGGADGLDAYRILSRILPSLLAPFGTALFEVGAGQAGAVMRLMQSAGLEDVSTCHDLGGIERCIIARPHPAPAATPAIENVGAK